MAHHNRHGLPARYAWLTQLPSGMSRVYRGYDSVRRCDVAIKLPRAAHRDRFERESRMLAQVSHHGVISLLDTGVSTVGTPFFTTPFVRGTRLDERETIRVPLVRALSIVAQLLDALAALHLRGIVHRDVAPRNVLVDETGKVTLLDLGLAKTVYETADITGFGGAVGAIPYTAPEQLIGHPEPASDLFSVGVILQELLLGSPTGSLACLPEAVAELLSRAQALDARRRFRCTGDFSFAVAEVSARASATVRRLPSWRSP